MTIEALYNQVLADDELKASLAKAAEEGTIAQWIAAQGVEATKEELIAYVKAAVLEGNLVSEEDLEKVAGGALMDGPTLSVILALQNIGCGQR